MTDQQSRNTPLSESQRLIYIADLIHPCSPYPDVINGYEICTCGRGVWPCPVTKAAWLARGLHIHTETKAAMERAKEEMMRMGG